MPIYFRNVLALAGALIASEAIAQVTFFEGERFEGQSFTAEKRVGNFERYGFGDRASSAIVAGDRWEVCEDAWFKGPCAVLRPGRYPSLAAMGLNGRIASVRIVGSDEQIHENRYSPVPVANTDNYRPRDERLYDANVISVRAVVGAPEQRCWVEREQISQEHRNANVPGAIAGALIGGVLGHQVGRGRGNDLATVGGAVAGAAVGSTVGRESGGPVDTRDVQHCSTTPSEARPDFWDVVYTFRGQEHRVQLTYPPGAAIRVNEQGEPRS